MSGLEFMARLAALICPPRYPLLNTRGCSRLAAPGARTSCPSRANVGRSATALPVRPRGSNHPRNRRRVRPPSVPNGRRRAPALRSPLTAARRSCALRSCNSRPTCRSCNPRPRCPRVERSRDTGQPARVGTLRGSVSATPGRKWTPPKPPYSVRPVPPGGRRVRFPPPTAQGDPDQDPRAEIAKVPLTRGETAKRPEERGRLSTVDQLPARPRGPSVDMT